MLRLPKESEHLYPVVASDSTVIMYPGVNKDGYFTNEQLADQTKKMLRIFDILHPGCLALVSFDNSANNHAMADDALVANRLNLKDGGKNVCQMRNGWFQTPDGNLQEHAMVSEAGKQKGIRKILQERGLFVQGMKLDKARKFLAAQPACSLQKALLNETVESSGHRIIFYPKFHHEFNFIEMFWGACKAYTRKHCDYSWKTLQNMVPLALNTVSIATIRRFARKSERYMDAYRIKGDVRLRASPPVGAIAKLY